MSSVKFSMQMPKTEEIGVQTVPFSCKSISTETTPFPTTSTQTESTNVISRQKYSENGGSENLRIDNALVELVIAEIAKFHCENALFTAIDQLNAGEQISLVIEKTLQIPATDRLPIVGVKCGNSANRVAVLFGQRSHDSWCTHNGRLMVYQRGQWYGTYLSNCPTQVQFTAQNNQVIVATALGEVIVVAEGETIWSSSKSNIHTLGVTCLAWFAPKQIISTGLDGRMNFLQQNPMNLEVLRTANITLSDLPRHLRKGNASTRKAGLVGVVQGQNGEMYVAGETGAVLAINGSDLTVQSTVAVEPEGIEQIAYVPSVDCFVIRTLYGQLKQIPTQTASAGNASSTRRILSTIRAKTDFCVNGSIVIVVDDEELVGWDLDTEQIVLRESHTFAAITLAGDARETTQLVGVTPPAEQRNDNGSDVKGINSMEHQLGRQIFIYRFSNEIN